MFRRCPHHANPLVVVDELIRELAKEFEAACLLFVCVDHLLKQKVGINADDADDFEAEPPVPMFCGKIAVHPQLIGADPFVPVNGPGTLVICLDCPRLGDLDNDRVWWRMIRLVQLAEALTKDVLPLSDNAHRHQEKSSTPLMAMSSVLPVSLSIDARTARDPRRGRVVFPRNYMGNHLLHCFTLPMKVRPVSFITNVTSTEAKYASAVTKRSE